MVNDLFLLMELNLFGGFLFFNFLLKFKKRKQGFLDMVDIFLRLVDVLNNELLVDLIE